LLFSINKKVVLEGFQIAQQALSPARFQKARAETQPARRIFLEAEGNLGSAEVSLSLFQDTQHRDARKLDLSVAAAKGRSCISTGTAAGLRPGAT